eukprot:8763035-Karenia_brevis.AAC.1
MIILTGHVGKSWPKAMTQLGDLTLAMLGTKEKPLMTTKGGENSGLLFFAVNILEEFAPKLKDEFNGNALLAAGKELVTYLQVMRAAPAKLRPTDAQAPKMMPPV